MTVKEFKEYLKRINPNTTSKKIRIVRHKSFNRAGKAQAKSAKIKGSLDFTTKLRERKSQIEDKALNRKVSAGKTVLSLYHGGSVKVKRLPIAVREKLEDRAIEKLLHAQQVLLAKKVLGIE